MGSTPDLPMYPEYEDTPFITRNRELNPVAYDYLTQAMENLDLYSGNTDAYQAVADAYTQAQWNDLNRSYNQAMNRQAAANYNRLGTSNATSNLYATDSAQRNYNDLASRVAANTASQYNNLVNQEYNRLANTLGIYNSLFNNSGAITEDVDRLNYNTRRENLDRQYQNDVNNSNRVWKTISGTISGIGKGATTGFMAGGPWGAVAGGVLGGVTGAMDGATGTNTQLPTSYAGLYNTGSGYGSSNSGINLANNNFGLNTTQLSGPYSGLINSGQQVSGSMLRNIWS